jgi:hypothetical protein
MKNISLHHNEPQETLNRINTVRSTLSVKILKGSQRENLQRSKSKVTLLMQGRSTKNNSCFFSEEMKAKWEQEETFRMFNFLKQVSIQGGSKMVVRVGNQKS